jgi:DNA-binding transcriptional MerR regulator
MTDRRVGDRRAEAGPGSDRFPIGELARRSGMTVRNIRAYQSRGVLDPPILERRTGYYDASHVERLETVRDLLASGLTLTAVHALLVGLSDLASDMSRLLDPMEGEHVSSDGQLSVRHPASRRRPVVFVPPARPATDAEVYTSEALGRTVGISALRHDLFADGLPVDDVYQLVRRLDELTDGILEEWVAALASYWEAATPTDSGDPAADARRLTDRLNPAAVDFAVAVFDLALRRRATELVASRTRSTSTSR